MLRHRLAMLAALCLGAIAAMPASAAAQEPFGITTGEPRGTYFAVAQDISELARNAGLELRVLPSQGSLENLYRVFTAPEAQLGIVQHDVLYWVRAQEGSDTARRMADRIKLVFPLYDEEVHVLARRDAGIERFADLAGKIVAVGHPGSGTAVTASVLFELAGIAPAETVEVAASEALVQLKRGALDALVYVAGAPVALFVDDIAPTDELVLVPIEDEAIGAIYGAPQVLDAANYPWAKDGVRTVAVKAVLVTYDYRSNRAKCTYVGDIANLVRAEIGSLRDQGHAKWQAVDLDAQVIGWDSSPCSVVRTGEERGASDPGFARFLEDMRQARQ